MAKKAIESLHLIRNPVLREAMRKALTGGDTHPLESELKFIRKPVSIEEFINAKEYMDARNTVYEKVLRALKEINSGKYVEVVFTGGIGSGKTTAALYTCAYQLYLLSCLRDPHHQFGLDPSTEIMMIFQNITESLAKRVGFSRFKSMIGRSPYFQAKFPFRKDLESKLVFPHRIEVLPVAGSGMAAIGQNVIGGMIDELNFMQVVEKSKQSVDGGTYDQAIETYNSISRRRKTRFMNQGQLPGILCLVSSRRYPGQFTDLKEAEAKTDPTIYIYDKCIWDIKPDSYCGQTFRVFAGDETHKPRVLGDGEQVRELHLVREIPIEHRGDFDRDIINALRDLAGVSTLAQNPFITNLEAVAACFDKNVVSVFSRDCVDFKDTRVTIDPKTFYQPEKPRWVHVDLGLTGDSAGLCIGMCDGFTQIPRGLNVTEWLPKIRLDGILEIQPPNNGEIQIAKIREVIYTLKEMGMNIQWVTFDSFQSADSIQLLRQKGFISGLQSMDMKPTPYLVTKDAFYDGRVAAPLVEKVLREFSGLEQDPKTGKIDHNPYTSKDLTDAIAGVVYGLTLRLETWTSNGISLLDIPHSIRDAQKTTVG